MTRVPVADDVAAPLRNGEGPITSEREAASTNASGGVPASAWRELGVLIHGTGQRYTHAKYIEAI